jgi:hypothetical protein
MKATQHPHSGDAAYDAGAKAFSRGEDGRANPYPKASDNATLWEDGFLDAQKAKQASSGKEAPAH